MTKIKSTQLWGRETAKERYKQPNKEAVSPAPTQQPPQDPEDKHEVGYDNDASGWVRGHGSPYPYFDKHKSGS